MTPQSGLEYPSEVSPLNGRLWLQADMTTFPIDVRFRVHSRRPRRRRQAVTKRSSRSTARPATSKKQSHRGSRVSVKWGAKRSSRPSLRELKRFHSRVRRHEQHRRWPQSAATGTRQHTRGGTDGRSRMRGDYGRGRLTTTTRKSSLRALLI